MEKKHIRMMARQMPHFKVPPMNASETQFPSLVLTMLGMVIARNPNTWQKLQKGNP